MAGNSSAANSSVAVVARAGSRNDVGEGHAREGQDERNGEKHFASDGM